MKRKQKTEKQKESDKKGAERMKRFKDNQEKPKKKKEVEPVDDGMTCQTYWEKDVKKGDEEWVERFYYYKKTDKKEKFSI